MKKIFFFILSITFMFFSCGQSKKSDDDSEARRQDSINQAEAQLQAQRDSIEKEKRDSAEWVDFTSADLKTLCLKGHVQQVQITSKFIRMTYSFDELGKLTAAEINDYLDIYRKCNIKRSPSGYISGFSINQQGIPEQLSAIDFTLNDKGVRTGINLKSGAYQGVYTTDTLGRPVTYQEAYKLRIVRNTEATYKYTAKDSIGNWTECSKSQKRRELNTWAENSTMSDWVQSPVETVTRKISYYQRNN